MYALRIRHFVDITDKVDLLKEFMKLVKHTT